MERLFVFIYQYRAFFTFVVLEVLCFWMIVRNNQYQGTKFFNSSNAIVATLNNVSQGIRDYFLLSEVNRTLADENAELRRLLEQKKYQLNRLDTLAINDSTLTNKFEFITAKVVNNQVDRFKNFITINKGTDFGIEPDMAVISPLGAVGKVKMVSEHYSVVTSLLHIDVMVSAVLKSSGHFGTVQWDGYSPESVKFNFIPSHVNPAVGDTVVTSGYNAIFPEGIMIGRISEVVISDEALPYDITVELSQDFRKLSFVTLVKSNLRHEQDSVEQKVLMLEK